MGSWEGSNQQIPFPFLALLQRAVKRDGGMEGDGGVYHLIPPLPAHGQKTTRRGEGGGEGGGRRGESGHGG